MTPYETPYEYLSPSPAVSRLMTALQDAEALCAALPAKTVRRVWDGLPAEALTRGLAGFALLEDGIEGGVLPYGDYRTDGDLRHHFANELGITTEQDFEEHFRALINGGELSRHYRRTVDALDVASLLRNLNNLGWSGFSVKTTSPAEEARIRRERMFVDGMRNEGDWTRMRALELVQAAYLCTAALHLEIISADEAARLCLRITGEAAVRWASWGSFARSLLAARMFEALSVSEDKAGARLAADTLRIDTLFKTLWAETPWPRVNG